MLSQTCVCVCVCILKITKLTVNISQTSVAFSSALSGTLSSAFCWSASDSVVIHGTYPLPPIPNWTGNVISNWTAALVISLACISHRVTYSPTPHQPSTSDMQYA